MLRVPFVNIYMCVCWSPADLENICGSGNYELKCHFVGVILLPDKDGVKTSCFLAFY